MSNRVYSFDGWVVDPAARELRRSGTVVAVPPKSFDCIVYLLERRDRAVGRDELVAAVWGKADVGDDQLAYVVRKARRAVSDSGDEQASIRTIPRFGFRWVRPVQVEEETGAASTGAAPDPARASAPPSTVAPAARAPWLRLLVPAGLSLVVLGAAYLWQARSNAPPGSRPDKTSMPAADAVAVLPIEGGPLHEPEWSWLRLGLMDLLASHLRDAGMTVVPSSNVVALLHDGKESESFAAAVRTATRSRYLVAPVLAKTGEDWVARLRLTEPGQPLREVEAHAGDPIRAARLAADRLLDRLGKRRPDGVDSPTQSADELYQRAEAAVLAGDFETARRRLAAAPKELLDDPELRLRQARVELEVGNAQEARRRFDELLPAVSAETDGLLRARVLIGLGSAYFRLGEQILAEPRLTQALVLLSGRNAPADAGAAYYRRATVRMFQSRYDEARTDFAQARIAFELAGDALAIARVELGEGALYGFMGRENEALPLFESAAARFERFGAVGQLSTAVSNQISAHLQLLQPAEALRVATLAGARFDHLENAQKRHMFEWQRARALIANGRLIEARVLLDALARGVDPDEEPGMLAWVRAMQARLDFDAGALESAAAVAMKAVEGSSAPRDISTRNHAWLTATRALRGLGRGAEAAVQLQRFREWADASGDSKVRHSVRIAEAEQVWADGRKEAAASLFDRVLDETAGSGLPSDVAEVALSYGNRLIDDGRLERASAVAGQVARWADGDFDCALLQARLYRALGQRDAWKSAVARARALAGERPMPRSVTIFEPGEFGNRP